METAVRLAPAHESGELEEIVNAQLAKPPEASPVAGVFEARIGYTNYLPNRTRRDQILQACSLKVEAGADLPWRIVAIDANRGEVALDLTTERASFASKRGEYWIDPTVDLTSQRDPPGSGGLLAACSLMRTLFTAGPDRLQDCYYVGALPRGPDRQLLDCVTVNHNGASAEFYFTPDQCRLERIEYFSDAAADACIVLVEWSEASDQRPAGIQVLSGDQLWLDLAELRLTTNAEVAP